MTRLETVKHLKALREDQGRIIAHGGSDAGKARDKFDAINKALDIIRDVNAADEDGEERFCPRCEERLADESVCSYCAELVNADS